MKGPSGVQWRSRGKASESYCNFQRKNNIFNVNLYRYKIVNIDLLRSSTLGHLREVFTGVQGTGPLVGVGVS